jgi:hypothetical protein
MPCISVPVALLAGAAVSGAASAYAAKTGSSAAKEAAGTQSAAADRAADLQMEMFQRIQQNLQPYIAAGGNALTQLQALTGTAQPAAASGAGSAPYGFAPGNPMTTPSGAPTIWVNRTSGQAWVAPAGGFAPPSADWQAFSTNGQPMAAASPGAAAAPANLQAQPFGQPIPMTQGPGGTLVPKPAAPASLGAGGISAPGGREFNPAETFYYVKDGVVVGANGKPITGSMENGGAPKYNKYQYVPWEQKELLQSRGLLPPDGLSSQQLAAWGGDPVDTDNMGGDPTISWSDQYKAEMNALEDAGYFKGASDPLPWRQDQAPQAVAAPAGPLNWSNIISNIAKSLGIGVAGMVNPALGLAAGGAVAATAPFKPIRDPVTGATAPGDSLFPDANSTMAAGNPDGGASGSPGYAPGAPARNVSTAGANALVPPASGDLGSQPNNGSPRAPGGANGLIPAGSPAGAAPAVLSPAQSFAQQYAQANGWTLPAGAGATGGNLLMPQAGAPGPAGTPVTVTGGQTGLNPTNAMLTAPFRAMQDFKPTMEQLEATPGYQFTLKQGLKAVQNQATAAGLGRSMPATLAAADYATGLASNTYQQQFSNYMSQYQQQFSDYINQNQQIYNMLMGQVTAGQNAAAGVGTQGVNTAMNAGNMLTSGAAANAAGTVGSANALSQGVLGIGNTASNTALMLALANNGMFSPGKTG